MTSDEPLGRRILALPPVRLVLALLFTLPPAGFIGALLDSLEEAGTLGAALAGVAGYCLYVRLIEKRRPDELALKGMAAELGVGLGLGIALIAASLGILFLLGCARFAYTGHWGEPGYWLLVFIGVGLIEELLARGIVYRLLEGWLGTSIAAALSALLFGALHLMNPNATLAGALSIAVTAGLLLALAYSLTRRLWLAVGLHIGWNWALGSLFGGVVSGIDKARGPLRTTLSGPDWLSGGAFGLEASPVAVLTCTALTTLFYLRLRRIGGLRAPFWSKHENR